MSESLRNLCFGLQIWNHSLIWGTYLEKQLFIRPPFRRFQKITLFQTLLNDFYADHFCFKKIFSSKNKNKNNDEIFLNKKLKLSKKTVDPIFLKNQSNQGKSFFFAEIMTFDVLCNVHFSFSSTVVKFPELRWGFSKPEAKMISGKVRNSRAQELISTDIN